jgi:hypothetical protein
LSSGDEVWRDIHTPDLAVRLVRDEASVASKIDCASALEKPGMFTPVIAWVEREATLTSSPEEF